MNTPHRIQTLYHFITGMLLYSTLALSPAQAETTNCTAITSVPFTITTQGVYCFTGHLSTNITSGNAIDIQANNVTIDMNGFKLGGLAAGTGTFAYGIYAYQRKNITIRNGIIRGFYRGILLEDSPPYTTSQGHVVRGILADQNTGIGIHVQGRGMTIRRNMVVDTGGSTIASDPYGIWVFGPGNNVLDNQVSTITATGAGGNAYGIKLDSADNSMVKDNRLSEAVASGSGTGYGIYMLSSNDVMVRNNIISVADVGIYYDSSTGLYGGNYTSSVTTPFTGGTAAGTTNHTNP